MTSPPDRLIATELRASLGENVIGRRIIVLQSTRSRMISLQMSRPRCGGFVVFAGSRPPDAASAASLVNRPRTGLWFSFCSRAHPARRSAR